MRKVILIFLLCLTTAAVQSQSETTVYNSAVEVSIESPKISFKNLCAFLAKTTAIDVAVDARCADQSFTLFLHNRKASDVFAALEAIVPGKWQKKPNSMTFLFVPDQAHMTEKQRWWKAYNTERNNVLQQQKQLLLQQMARKPATNRIIESITDKNMREAVRNYAISHAFWPSLDASQQNKIADLFDNLDSYGKRNWFSPRGEGGTFVSWSEISVASRKAAFAAAVHHGQNIVDTKFTGVLFTSSAQFIDAALVRDDGRQSGDVVLSGRLDRIDEHHDSTLEIVDYKSGRTEVAFEDVSESLALSIYQLLLKQTFPDRRVFATLTALKRGQSASHELSNDARDSLRADCLETGDMLRTRDWEHVLPVINDHCPHCDFLPHCRKFWRHQDAQHDIKSQFAVNLS